jgi:hypothetical protein
MEYKYLDDNKENVGKRRGVMLTVRWITCESTLLWGSKPSYTQIYNILPPLYVSTLSTLACTQNLHTFSTRVLFPYTLLYHRCYTVLQTRWNVNWSRLFYGDESPDPRSATGGPRVARPQTLQTTAQVFQYRQCWYCQECCCLYWRNCISTNTQHSSVCSASSANIPF